MPKFWATVWLTSLQAGPAPGTLYKMAPYVAKFYETCEGHWGRDCVDEAVSTGDAPRFLEFINHHLAELTRDPGKMNTSTVSAWATVRAFASHCATYWMLRDQAWLVLHGHVDTMPPINLPRGGEFTFPRALPIKVQEEVLQICTPGDERNARQSKFCQHRNWLCLNLLLQGLRRGEVLLLLVDSLKSDYDDSSGELVYWVDVITTPEEIEDGRYSKPSIKTDESIRQVPVSADIARMWEAFVSEFRAEGSNQFLLTTEAGVELSPETINVFFRDVTMLLSEDALRSFRVRTGGKKYVSPHDFRHTRATDVYVQLMRLTGRNEPLVFQRMRLLFGWSSDSKMPELYAAAAIKEDQADLMRKVSDSNLEAIRKLVLERI